MRIIGGRFKGRTLAPPLSRAIRPSSDRLRESLFNILAHACDFKFEGARVLDLCAGTGALGFESLSRGAVHCTFVDTSAEARALIRTTLDQLGCTGCTKLLKRDATALDKRPAQLAPAHLVFCDPPYALNLGLRALHSAIDGDWVEPGAVMVLEDAATIDVAAPAKCALIDTRVYGAGRVHIFRFNGG